MPTLWSLILNRKDQLLQQFWTEWRAPVITQSSGPASAGSIPMLDPQGQIDPSMIPGGSGGDGVTSLNGLTGAVTIGAGDGITVTVGGQTITLSSTATGSGHVIEVNGIPLPQESILNFNGPFTGADDPINLTTNVSITTIDGNSIVVLTMRGPLGSLPSSLPTGEFYFATDTNQLYIGTGSGVLLIGPISPSGAPTVTALVDFGFSSGDEGDVARLTIPAPWVTSGSLIFCQSMAVTTPDHEAEDAAYENIQVWAENLVPGTSFDVIAYAPQNSWGRYMVQAVGF